MLTLHTYVIFDAAFVAAMLPLNITLPCAMFDDVITAMPFLSCRRALYVYGAAPLRFDAAAVAATLLPLSMLLRGSLACRAAIVPRVILLMPFADAATNILLRCY